MKLRYGCVGAGGIARNKHMKAYKKIQDIEFVAVSDPNIEYAKEAAQEFGFNSVYSDYEEMLEKEELDFISVCTPNFLHAPVTIAALEKGIHVHCEKPIALNAKEAQDMVDAKNKAGKKLMVALNNRFTNHAYFVKKYAQEGLFGEIYHVKCGWRRRRGIPGKGGWFTDKKMSGGGPLIDLGVHFMDLAMFFVGYPEPIAVTGAVYSKFSQNKCLNSHSWGMDKSSSGVYDVEDLAVGFIRLENGATLDVEFSWASNIEEDYTYYEILGTKGGACFKKDELKIFTEQLDTLVDITPNLNYAQKPIDEFEHFIDCIVHDKEPMASPEEAVKLMKIIDGIYQSSETKKEVTYRHPTLK